MLVINHEEGDILQIGDDVRILVGRVKGGWVKLCIDAPRAVPVNRIVGAAADTEAVPAAEARRRRVR